MKHEIDKHKVKYSIAVILYSALASYFFQPFIHGNKEAINVIVTVFSILAGFLVAVITIIGDPSSLPKGGWQKAQLGSEIINNRLTRHKWLFTIYLSTLFLIFISMLIKGKWQFVDIWVERTYLFFAICAFTMSFRLPSVLMALHEERIEQEIKSRREKEGISD